MMGCGTAKRFGVGDTLSNPESFYVRRTNSYNSLSNGCTRSLSDSSSSSIVSP